jgi:hypothetical protein
MVSATTTFPGHWLKDETSANPDMPLSSLSQGPPFLPNGLPHIGFQLRGAHATQRRDYRLIDSLQQPHPQLDGLYDSVDEAMADAIGWLESIGPGAGETSIGLEVSTPCGSWRTIRQPDLLLCPLPPQRSTL